MTFLVTRRFAPMKFLAAILCLFALSASAQFNGPGLGPGTAINQPTTITTDQTLLFPPFHEVKLGPADTISIRVFGQDYSPVVRIGVDGNVLLPLLGVVQLSGMTITEAEIFLANKLKSAQLFVDPQVTVQVTEGPNSSVTFVGEAHGIVQVTGTRRLLDVLSAAGGLPTTASHIITINRPGLDQPLVIDLGTDPARSALANIPVFPGDTIIVAKVGSVYFLGSFKSQGKIDLTQNTPLTLLEAAALNGGPSYDAKYNDLRLIRTVAGHRTVVKLDIKKIMYGKAPDPILQPDDILFLPPSYIKASLTNGNFGTLLTLISLGLTLNAFYR